MLRQLSKLHHVAIKLTIISLSQYFVLSTVLDLIEYLTMNSGAALLVPFWDFIEHCQIPDFIDITERMP
jgi:hypothetical protein